MGASVVTLHLKLEVATRKDGKVWLAWCPSIDVMTQGPNKKAAIDSLREAVHLWFDSCIERGVLDRALKEAGFKKMRPGQALPKNTSIVHVASHSDPVPDTHTFSARDYIEVSMPAYIAAKYLEPSAAH